MEDFMEEYYMNRMYYSNVNRAVLSLDEGLSALLNVSYRSTVIFFCNTEAKIFADIFYCQNVVWPKMTFSCLFSGGMFWKMRLDVFSSVLGDLSSQYIAQRQQKTEVNNILLFSGHLVQ